ncbi:Beta-hexosaminidase A [Lachnellula suecica]|uniref:Beta-hexosaminidase A n=1 Tax=Lachnellula suecica TaxID=602035 RepID=A0A8T9CAK0_9HELO|nr:Beta-hexosaminidase A [Lachnellula suecica]
MPEWSEEVLKDIVGQLFIVGFHGYIANDNIKELITKYRVGSVVLFQRNVQNATQLRELTNSLQQIARDAGHSHDLLIAIDQENGLVTRIKPPIATQLPGAMTLAATRDPENAYMTACATAQTLKAFGINMNYGPVADVNSEPKNPVIGVRSPSDKFDLVGTYVSRQIKGFEKIGVASCVKHWPGHGDTSEDQILAKLPASLNPLAIRPLRQHFKFKGLIISDCLEMDGNMEESLERVNILKSKYAPRAALFPINLPELQRQNEEQERLASQIYAKSTTVVRSSLGVTTTSSGILQLPKLPEDGTKIVFLSPKKGSVGGAVESGEEKTRVPHTPKEYINLLRTKNRDIKHIEYDKALSRHDSKSVDDAEIVILATRNAIINTEQKALGLHWGKKLGERLIVIATCDPYDFMEDAELIKNYITIYEPTIPAFQAAVNLLFGDIEPGGPFGSLPVGHEILIQAIH